MADGTGRLVAGYLKGMASSGTLMAGDQRAVERVLRLLDGSPASPSGRCPVCRQVRQVRGDGTIRMHHGQPGRRTPGGNCLGSGEEPADA